MMTHVLCAWVSNQFNKDNDLMTALCFFYTGCTFSPNVCDPDQEFCYNGK